MYRIAALLVVVASLTACDMISTLIDGWKYAKAVEADLEAATGMKPDVGFDWKNGRLVRVTVTFPRLYDAKPLPELAAIVRRAVDGEFKQTAETVVLGFALGKADSARTAQRSGPDD